ncbi:hypothetical protein GCM10007301_17140 [Azorhizobium oxalatiphilum]|uniref:Nif11 domain-containing protein n=1 Tax=Azorhizobium oxalatiphilum TaxID=980631 RepID=A0A917BV51_9HYPH|nr:hypothetical protein [Azorhizobium oxalatiphilum]GGF57974.1 hypothetical protein GCM10007301_17140 [Azorhizobium oxalatiphilum]
MAQAEIERLISDLNADTALRDRLAPQLDACPDAETAATLLRAAGYGVDAADLPRQAQPLDDAALDGVAGGADGDRNQFIMKIF